MAKSKTEKAKPEYDNRLQQIFGKPKEADIERINRSSVQFDSREQFDAEKYWKTGLIPFDLLTNTHGLPQGGMVHIWCENGIGKSTIFYAAIRSAITYSGLKVWWLGFEPTLELAMGMKLIGPDRLYDLNQFRYLDEARYYSDLERVAKDFIVSDANILVIDSLTSIARSPSNFVKPGSLEKATVGTKSRIETLFMENIHAWCQDVNKTVMYVTQARNKIATQKWQKGGIGSAGSEASGHYSTMRISLRGAKKITTKAVGIDGVEKNVGTQAWIFTEKCRHGVPYVKIPISILYGSGVSNLTAMKDFLVWEGSHLTVGGAGWYTLRLGGEEKKMQGLPALYDAIRPKQAEVLDLFYSQRGKDYFEYWREQSTYGDDEEGGE